MIFLFIILNLTMSHYCNFVMGFATSKGFGTGVSGSSGTKVGGSDPAFIPSLNKEAKRLLKKHKNNIDSASRDYFESHMKQNLDVSSGGTPVEELHSARVKATWNTIALFLPADYQRKKGKIDPLVRRRLRHIANACHGEDGSHGFDLLDVGCGDGSLIPFLPKNCSFCGIDISSEMISLAKQKYPKNNFIVGSFPDDLPKESLFDTIVFNGSLQFFRDTRLAIEQACSLLKHKGRIVLSHVNGAKFVKDECQKNPGVAIRNMPNNLNLETMAVQFGLRVLGKSSLKLQQYDEGLDGSDDEFYLIVFEKV
jgi:SAM-dependent methyltransferase